MARWKTIESAPRDRSILVDGGTIFYELSEYPEETQDEPAKVAYNGSAFHCVDTCGYSVTIHNPIYWTDLPARAIQLEFPRPVEYDL